MNNRVPNFGQRFLESDILANVTAVFSVYGTDRHSNKVTEPCDRSTMMASIGESEECI